MGSRSATAADEVPRRLSLPSHNSVKKAVKISSHDSIESTSSTLTDASDSEKSPVREVPTKVSLKGVINGVEDAQRALGGDMRDELDLADFESIDDEDDAMFASMRRRSDALSLCDSKSPPEFVNTIRGQLDMGIHETNRAKNVPVSFIT